MSNKICDNKSVGILVWRGGKLLLIERANPPYGFAPPAGHVDDDFNSFEEAARGELNEETGLTAHDLKLIIEGKKDNACRRKGGSWHYWKIYEADATGDLKRSREETKQAGWYTIDEIKTLAKRTEDHRAGRISEVEWTAHPGLEPVWYLWFRELSLIH